MAAAEGINVFGRPPHGAAHGTARLAPPVSHGNAVTDHHDAPPRR